MKSVQCRFEGFPSRKVLLVYEIPFVILQRESRKINETKTSGQ
jgi:hypothetical protein